MVESSQPATVRAEYGPFETSQMVPTQYLVPDLMLEQESYDDKKQLALITDFEPHQLDLSAHLVTNEVCISRKVAKKCVQGRADSFLKSHVFSSS